MRETTDMKKTIAELVDDSLDLRKRQVEPVRREPGNDSYRKYVKALEEKRHPADVSATFARR